MGDADEMRILENRKDPGIYATLDYSVIIIRICKAIGDARACQSKFKLLLIFLRLAIGLLELFVSNLLLVTSY